MDKYTVDLDKVLNDFEYSELTEQSNGFSAAAAAAAAAVTQPNSGPNHAYTKVTYSYESTPAPPSYSKVSANSSAKHTINNVFHSLNEYLNSDIRTDFSEQPSAAPAAAAAASGSSSLANINEIEADAPSLVVRKTSADHAVAKIQDLFKTIPKEDENNAVIGGDSAGAVGAGLADVKTINNNINSELNLNRVKASNVPLDDETLSVKVENTSVNQRERNNIGKGRSSSSSSSHAQNLEKHNNTTSLHTVVNTEDASLNPEQSNNIDVNSHAGHVETINNNIAVVEQFEKTNADTANGDETSLAVRSIGETVPQPPGDTNKQLMTVDTVARETALLDKQVIETNVVETNDVETKVVQTKIVDTKHLETKDVETKHVETKVDEAKDVEINVVKTKEVETKGVETIVETKIVETKVVETKDTETKGTETKDVETKLVETNDVEIKLVETKDAETTVVETKDAETTVVGDVSPVQPIGFEDVDISDSEMESALTELEQEYNHQQVGNNLLENADEFSEEKDLQTELEEVTGVKLLASTDSTVMSATNETEPTSETCAATVATINENTQQQHHHQLAAEVHGEPRASAEDDFRAIADRMMKTKELIAKRYETNQIGEENRPNQRTDEFTAFMNKIQETEDRNRQTMNKTQRCEAESEEKVEENADDTQLMRQSNEICENAPRKSDNCNAAITIEAPDGSVTVENTTDASATQPERNSAGTSADTPAITVQTDEASAARRNSTLLRPNSLDLAGEQLTIDLIGEPGSTPYNNVYVESTLKPSTVVPEADTSLSPTLSDASTYENTDSPNTSDSCNDTSFDEPAGDKSAVATSAEGAEPAGAAVAEPGTAVQGPLLGKTAPFWTPDSDTLCCLHCNQKFTVLRRRHHCRACGLVLCAKCSNMKYKLEYMDNLESRVCLKCYDILSQEATAVAAAAAAAAASSSSGSEHSPVHSAPGTLNPNNPMDYCSTVPPHQQVGNVPNQPPTVMVPVGVLKRKGSGKSRSSKSVMFCDGIRPGCDLTELDRDFNYKDQQQQQLLLAESSSAKRASNNLNATTGRANRNLPKVDTKTLSYIPAEDNSLPPIVNVLKSDTFYAECSNNGTVVEMLKQETITFALQRNLHVQVRIINMDCCINKHAWCFTTDGMIAVGQDEIVVLLEFIDNEKIVPKDVFLHLSHIYQDAVKGTSISELGLSVHPSSNFLDSKNHVGLLFVKPTFQCIQNVILPKEPYLVGILIHRWETPWAKIFPLRLLLRLGAEYRYYPSPIISTRHRESVYVEIGHTIINLLADFRNFSYTIPSVRGLTIHMEEKNTTVSIPINRYDQVIKALNNSSDHILAFAANFSSKADSHLVCIQDTHGNNENAYTTHAINIHNKPRKVTGASFIVLNGALKSSSGLTAKSSIIEDGLMIQILPDQMVKLRTSLRNMKDFKIQCGCVNAQSDESVSILWTENDTNFNVGVTSPIDNTTMAGVPSIRVHNGKDYVCNSGNKMIRWTEVFIVQSGEENARTQDPVDISKVSESISKATCQALVKYLDLLATNSFAKIGIRTTLHVENVSYLAGSNGTKLPPIYMKSLDNELVPALHKITSNNFGEQAVILELVFHILNM